MISQVFKSELLLDEAKKVFYDISCLISKKIIRWGLNDELCQLMYEAAYCVYVYIKNHKEEYGFKDFHKVLEKNLSFICVGSKIMGPNGKSEGRIIFINPKIILFPQKFLLVFTHELVHTMAAGRYSTGLIRNRKIFRHNNMKFINDHFTAFSSFWDLNEVQTEYIAISSLSRYFELDEKQYEFHLSNGLKVKIFSKCFSYKDFFVYISVINYIYKNQMISAYLNYDSCCEDVIYNSEFNCIQEAFLNFYKAYRQYLDTFEEYEKEDDKHSCVKFEVLTEKFVILIEKYMETNDESCIEELKDHILENKLYIEGEEKSWNAGIVERIFAII